MEAQARVEQVVEVEPVGLAAQLAPRVRRVLACRLQSPVARVLVQVQGAAQAF